MSNAEKYVYIPEYYESFKCIAEKCLHSCCVDWEIDIDKKTLSKYKSIGDSLCQAIKEDGDGAHIILDSDGRCPYLNESGLCNIILSYGEDYLSDICREHPRFYNETYERVEAGIGIVCEEACRLVLGFDRPFSLKKVGKIDVCPSGKTEYSALAERDRIISVIENTAYTFNQKLEILNKQFGIDVEIHSMNEWLDILLQLEILDEEWRDSLISAKAKKAFNSQSKFDKYYERLLSYLVYRHVTVAQSAENLRARLGFAMLGALTVKYLFEREECQSENKLFDFARLFSSEIEYSEENTALLILEFESAV